jgi:ubiquinone/menaquinone biosynthesis C-methylase UbiE
MERMLAATAAAEDNHYWFRALRRHASLMLDQAAPGRTFDRILDCGAGTGRNLEWLSRRGRTVGVELSRFGVRAAAAHRRPMIQGSVTHLPFRAETFELATSFDVLYCLDDESERRAITEMWRVLKPGGLVLVNAAALDILHGSHSTLTAEVRRYTRRRLTERLAQAGFRVQRMSYTNMTLFLPALTVRGLERLTGRASKPSDADLRVPLSPVNAALDLCLRAEAAVLSRADLPIGTSLMALAAKPR